MAGGPQKKGCRKNRTKGSLMGLVSGEIVERLLECGKT